MPSASIQARMSAFEQPAHSQSRSSPPLARSHTLPSKPKPTPNGNPSFPPSTTLNRQPQTNPLDATSPSSPTAANLSGYHPLSPTVNVREKMSTAQSTPLAGLARFQQQQFTPPPGTIPGVPQPKAAPPIPRKPVPSLSTSYATYVPKAARTMPPMSLAGPSTAPPLPPRKTVMPTSFQQQQKAPRHQPSLTSIRSNTSSVLSAPSLRSFGTPPSLTLSPTPPPSGPSTPLRPLTHKHSHTPSTSSFQSVSLSSTSSSEHLEQLQDKAETATIDSSIADTASFDIVSPGGSPGSSLGLGDDESKVGDKVLQEERTPIMLQKPFLPSSSSKRAVSAPTTPPRIITPPQPQAQRRPPIPPPAYARYTSLFERNLPASSSPTSSPSSTSASTFSHSDSVRTVTPGQSVVRSTLMPPPPSRRERGSTGWRGTSIDGLPLDEDTPVSTASDGVKGGGEERKEERLPGYVVKTIWSTSKVPREKLHEIWAECDPQKTGSLDKEGFARGMWRIDEELRRAKEAKELRAKAARSKKLL